MPALGAGPAPTEAETMLVRGIPDRVGTRQPPTGSASQIAWGPKILVVCCPRQEKYP